MYIKMYEKAHNIVEIVDGAGWEDMRENERKIVETLSTKPAFIMEK